MVGVATYNIMWFYLPPKIEPNIMKPEIKFEAYLTLERFVTNFLLNVHIANLSRFEKFMINYSSLKLTSNLISSFIILGSIFGGG